VRTHDAGPSQSIPGIHRKLFPAGAHICQIFSEDDERQASLFKFLLSGLRSGERACCFSEKVQENVLTEYLGNYGISYHEVRDSGALTLSGTRQVYFQGDCFDPDRMIGLLRAYHTESVSQGYPGARVIGEKQAFRELRRINPGVRVLMSSGYNEQEVTLKFVGKGLAGFLQKPYNLSEIGRKIQEILEER